jgi:hypothetical protein
MDLQFHTPHLLWKYFRWSLVQIEFVGVTSSDIDLRDQEEPLSTNETETAGD